MVGGGFRAVKNLLELVRVLYFRPHLSPVVMPRYRYSQRPRNAARRLGSRKPSKAARPCPMQGRKEENGACVSTRARRRRLQTRHAVRAQLVYPRSQCPRLWRFTSWRQYSCAHPRRAPRGRAPRLRVRLYAWVPPRRQRVAPSVPPGAPPTERAQCARGDRWEFCAHVRGGRAER